MTIIGADRSGPRVQCSVHRESGCCENGARYYAQKLERLVIDALGLQLNKPEMINEYLKAYRVERNSVETSARRNRSKLEKEREGTRGELNRILSAIAKGLVSEEEAADLLNPLRCDISKIDAELANASSVTNVVELHPQAVKRFKENVEELADILSTDGAADPTQVATFRSLVEAVVVLPRQAGGQHQVQIKGRLAALMGIETSAIMMVAGDRYLRYPRPLSPEFMVSVA